MKISRERQTRCGATEKRVLGKSKRGQVNPPLRVPMIMNRALGYRRLIVLLLGLFPPCAEILSAKAPQPPSLQTPANSPPPFPHRALRKFQPVLLFSLVGLVRRGALLGVAAAEHQPRVWLRQRPSVLKLNLAKSKSGQHRVQHPAEERRKLTGDVAFFFFLSCAFFPPCARSFLVLPRMHSVCAPRRPSLSGLGSKRRESLRPHRRARRSQGRCWPEPAGLSLLAGHAGAVRASLETEKVAACSERPTVKSYSTSNVGCHRVSLRQS